MAWGFGDEGLEPGKPRLVKPSVLWLEIVLDKVAERRGGQMVNGAVNEGDLPPVGSPHRHGFACGSVASI